MTRVAVVGSVNLDLTVAVSHLPDPGETVLGSDVSFRPGGKGGNQAVAARRMGADTVLFAAVGADRFGTDLRTALQAEGLPATGLTTIDGVATGLAMIVVEGTGENTIVVAPGANELLDGQPLTAQLPPLLAPGTVLLLQLEIPIATCLGAARLARSAGATVLLNAAPLPKVMDPVFAELLTAVDVLVVNEGEAWHLSGEQGDPPRDDAGWQRLAAGLTDLGPQVCVVTLGGDGAVLAGPGKALACAGFAVPVVDTTGAGDAFCGALAVSLAQGLALGEALRRSCAVGALATTRMGAQAALPTVDEVDGFLARDGRA
ncbi:ribokinase [Micromonospora sp. WMMD975]|uniref:ribokinase n=1 Tax=Micromonospora sp. WMMD975 TaxID=3016087 RepID=UPI00249A8000|nr:ribokinase [Micromonospora sp. WMMD975]WFE32752.1 ribokinase [Micromonospora sp. WMMD975]